MAVTWKKLAYEDDVILKSFIAAKGDLIGASGDNTPVILPVGTDGKVLAAASGEVSGMAWVDTGAGDFKADGSVPMTAALNFAGKQAQDMVIHSVADNTAKLALTPVVGKIAFQLDELAFYGCTVAA